MKLQHRCEWISKIPLCGWQAWKNWFFIITIFLARAIFWLFSDLMDQRMAGGKKIIIIKNHFFHARQQHKGIFVIHSLLCCNFMTSFPELLMATTIQGVEIFCWKSACVVLFYMQNSNFGGASESERIGFVLATKMIWDKQRLCLKRKVSRNHRYLCTSLRYSSTL